MKKLALLVLILAFITACTDIDTGSGQNNWRTGTEGIVFGFMPENPPSEVLSTASVNVVLKYSNKGASETIPYFYLTGYDPNILSFSNPYVPRPSIEGKTRYNTEGSQDNFIEWNAPINMNSLYEVDSFSQSISATACYRYETIAHPSICIDTEGFGYTDSGCDFSIKDLGSSQGGPIVVSEVKQSSSGEELFLEIHFQNKGGGTPYVSDSFCLNLGYDEVDVIYVAEVSMPQGSFSCEPSTVRLVNNDGYTICRRSISDTDTYYESQLQIRARYNYRETLPKKQITIVNVNRN